MHVGWNLARQLESQGAELAYFRLLIATSRIPRLCFIVLVCTMDVTFFHLNMKTKVGPSMVRILRGWFLDNQSKHLNSFFLQEDNQSVQVLWFTCTNCAKRM